MENRTDKVIAIGLHLGAGMMCIAAGVEDELVVLLIPAMGSWIAGLRLWARAAGISRPPAEPSRVSDGQLARLEERLASLQEDVAHLREDREFFESLYRGGGQPRGLRERSTIDGS